MTINKKCFNKSLRHDYPESLMWFVVIVITIILGYVSITYWEYIVKVLSSLSIIPPSMVISIGVACVMAYVYIVEGGGMSKETAKSQTCRQNLWEVEVVIAFCYFLGFVFYTMVSGTLFTHSTPTDIACAYECCIGLIIFTIVNLLVTPIILAYARCKDEPEEVTENGESHTTMVG